MIVARTDREMTQAAPGYRALGSASDPQGGMGGAQNLWQWQQQGLCILRDVRTMGGTQLQCHPQQ